MRVRTLIGAGVAAALIGGLLIYQSPVSAQGWGMMRDHGPGYHMGWNGSGPGWNCPAFGSDDAARSDNGYGPGNRMPGWGLGHGPGMMRGYGYNRGSGPQGNLNLTADDVKNRMARWLEWRNNPRLKLGDVKENDADTITAEIVTKDNSLVDRFIVDRHNGFTRRDNG
jgi:hypothetical protein